MSNEIVDTASMTIHDRADDLLSSCEGFSMNSISELCSNQDSRNDAMMSAIVVAWPFTDTEEDASFTGTVCAAVSECLLAVQDTLHSQRCANLSK